MPNVYVVRAEFGTYAKHFVDGGYVGLGWSQIDDLSKVKSRDDLYPIYKKAYPDDTSNVVIGQQVGQLARFLLEIQPGDYVITPDADTDWLHVGVIQDDPLYYYADSSDGCKFRHRRPVKWQRKMVKRSQFSVPFQNTIRSSLTVFAVSHKDHFFDVIGQDDLISKAKKTTYDPHEAVLKQVLELSAEEFEILITHLLTALGFEGSEHTGKPGDGGVDATGELDVANLAKIKIFVQAKRYQLGQTISASVVKSLRQSIPQNGQGAFITTAGYQKKAYDVATEHGFPRIGLINGSQLVDLLVEHWEEIPKDFQDKLGLKPGLVLS